MASGSCDMDPYEDGSLDFADAFILELSQREALATCRDRRVRMRMCLEVTKITIEPSSPSSSSLFRSLEVESAESGYAKPAVCDPSCDAAEQMAHRSFNLFRLNVLCRSLKFCLAQGLSLQKYNSLVPSIP